MQEQWPVRFPYALMGPALAEGYATSGTDTGHVGNNGDFMPEHPEKLIDFAYRAIHDGCQRKNGRQRYGNARSGRASTLARGQAA